MEAQQDLGVVLALLIGNSASVGKANAALLLAKPWPPPSFTAAVQLKIIVIIAIYHKPPFKSIAQVTGLWKEEEGNQQQLAIQKDRRDVCKLK